MTQAILAIHTVPMVYLLRTIGHTFDRRCTGSRARCMEGGQKTSSRFARVTVEPRAYDVLEGRAQSPAEPDGTVSRGGTRTWEDGVGVPRQQITRLLIYRRALNCPKLFIEWFSKPRCGELVLNHSTDDETAGKLLPLPFAHPKAAGTALRASGGFFVPCNSSTIPLLSGMQARTCLRLAANTIMLRLCQSQGRAVLWWLPGEKNMHKQSTAAPSRWLLDIPEAQRELHLSRAAIFRLLARGELGSIKLGRRRLIPVREIEEFIARQGGAA